MTMTGKERAALRAKANSLEPLFQIGKGGVTEAVIAQTETAYNTKELIKIKVLPQSSPVSAREAARILAEETKSDIIQVIGGVLVLFRVNEQLRKKEQAKKKRAVAAANPKPEKPYYAKMKTEKGALRSFSDKKSKER
jgi:RNA-binding protein